MNPCPSVLETAALPTELFSSLLEIAAMNIYYTYFQEIKNRIILSLFSWLFLILVCYSYKETLLFITIDLSNDSTTSTLESYFIFTNVTEIFYVYLNLTLFISNQLIILTILYHVTIFISAGLYNFEFVILKLVIRTFLFCWLGSVLLLTKIIVPISWSFFLSFQENSELAQPITLFFEAKIEEYFSYFTNLYFICLINCQFLALVVFILNSLSESLKRIKVLRKLFYLIFVIFSTMTTPPDVISQIVMSVCLITIYELFIFVHCLKLNMAAS